ncbi:MAG: SGNH/GDSL hydrolase family protein [Phycisphaerae bacterium]|nr:SGNH/GDSL hydrolase family protein [Phycisphaerae bacterium]
MKLARIVVCAFVALLAQCVIAAGPRLKHVAVIGDAAASGAGPTAKLDAWPEQLGRVLAPDHATRSFVRINATTDPESPRYVFRSPDWPVIKAFEPAIVVVALGSADAMDPNFVAQPFAERYAAVLDELLALPSHPTIVVCLPPPCDPRWSRAAVYQQHRTLAAADIKRCAAARSLAIVDLEPALLGSEATLTQGIVADAAAGERIATAVATVVLGKPPAIASGMYRPIELPHGLVRRVLVENGTAHEVTGHHDWPLQDGALVASGATAGLATFLKIGEGPFSMRWRLIVEGGENDGPQLALDTHFVLLENSGGSVQVKGRVFRGNPILRPASEVWKRGVPFDVELRRAHHDIELRIDGVLLYVAPAPAAVFDVGGIIPRASTVRLLSWTVDEPAQADAPPVNPEIR